MLILGRKSKRERIDDFFRQKEITDEEELHVALA